MNLDLISIVLIVLAIAGIWAVCELSFTLRKTRKTLDEISHSATEAIDQTVPIIAKLDGVVDDLQPTLRSVPGLVEKVEVTIDEANVALGSVGGILGDVSSATHGVASVGESASRIVNTATSAAVGVVSKVASIGGITIPEGQQLIAGGEDSAEAAASDEAGVAPQQEPEAPRGGYVTYAPVTTPKSEEE